MDQLGGLPAGNAADGSEVELESLGLGLFDLDADLAECFENCPEWNDPLLDTSVLDELRDCLSDDLWSSPDLQLLTEGDGGTQTAESQQEAAGPSCMASPPLSPESVLSPPPSVASTGSCLSSDPATPQKVPASPGNGTGLAQNGMTVVGQNGTGPCQNSGGVAIQQQSSVWNMAQVAAPSPTAVQVLKSGEVVQMMKVNPQPLQLQQQNTGVVMSPPPILTPASSVGSPPPPLPPHPNSAIPPVSGTAGSAGSSVTPGAVATAAARKRQHPDNEAPARDTKSAGGGVNIAQLSKKQQRLIKNQFLLQTNVYKEVLNKMLKGTYVQTLEARLREAAHKNTTLLQENEALRKQVLQLQAENKLLRVSLSQSGSSSFITLQKPAVVMVLSLCFLSLLFLPKFSHLSLVSPPGSTSTALSVTQSSHVTGRALLEYRETSTDPALLAKPASSLEPSEQTTNSHRAHGSSSSRRSSALVPVSTTVADRHRLEEALDRKLQELRRLYAAMPCPQPPPVSSVCSCPAQNDTSNTTALRLLGEEMAGCFKWYEAHYPRWLHPNKDSQSEKSLAVVVKSSGGYQLTELHDMPLFYKSFKKYFTRKLDTFYLISFKDHLLLNAPLHNTTEPPILSVIIPTQGISHEDTFPMLQMDCEILNTNIIHLPRATTL